MSATKDAASKKRDDRFRKIEKKAPTFVGWVNRDISKPEMVVLKGLEVEKEFAIKDVFWLPEQGYKFTISRNLKQGGYTCCLFDNEPTSESCGWALSAWGSSPENAWVALMYKHRTLMPDGWELPDTKAIGTDYG